MTYEKLKKINEGLKTIDPKYIMVADRVDSFRQLYPEGSITTEITLFDDRRVIVKATATDEQGTVLATGHASEVDGSSYINNTSFVEDCETHAVVRCLGFLGIGIDESFTSAEEVANTITQQADYPEGY